MRGVDKLVLCKKEKGEFLTLKFCLLLGADRFWRDVRRGPMELRRFANQREMDTDCGPLQTIGYQVTIFFFF